jgi:hypothetical protein
LPKSCSYDFHGDEWRAALAHQQADNGAVAPHIALTETIIQAQGNIDPQNVASRRHRAAHICPTHEDTVAADVHDPLCTNLSAVMRRLDVTVQIDIYSGVSPAVHFHLFSCFGA